MDAGVGMAGGPFQYDFMVRAFAAGTVVGVVAPVVGLFLVLRRLSLIGDALAHVSLAGVAGGLFYGVHPAVASLAVAVGAGGLIEYLRGRFRRHGELAVATTLSTAVALASVLFSLGGTGGVDLMAYLFGSVLTVSPSDVALITALGAAVLGAVAWFYLDLLTLTLDEDLARTKGLPVQVVNVAFTGLAAATVAASMRVVGVLLVSSLMVLPVAASLQVARSFRGALALSVVAAEAAVWGGLMASYYLNIPAGGAVVLTAVALLLAALLVRRLRPEWGPS